MAKKPMSDAQKYRKANARGAGPGAEGRAKIRAAEKLAKKSEAELSKRNVGEGTIYGLRTEGSRKLGQDYARKIGGKGEEGYYAKGGLVKKARGGSLEGRGEGGQRTFFDKMRIFNAVNPNQQITGMLAKYDEARKPKATPARKPAMPGRMASGGKTRAVKGAKK